MQSRLSELSTLDLLHRASQIAENAFERRIGRKLGLTARQYAILRAVASKEGLSQTAIVEATGIDRSTGCRDNPPIGRTRLASAAARTG